MFTKTEAKSTTPPAADKQAPAPYVPRCTYSSLLNPSKKPPIEVMPTEFSSGFWPTLGAIMIEYLGGDLNPNWAGDEKTKSYTDEERSQFKLMGRRFIDLLSAEAAAVATLVLHGDQEQIDTALFTVRENKSLLFWHCIAKDRSGRPAFGTLAEIAAIGGDWNLIPGDTGGAVELLSSEAGMSPEVAFQKVTSEEAKRETARRNDRVIAMLITFAVAVLKLKVDKDMEFKTFENRCQPLLDAFVENLDRFATEELITQGLIYDLGTILFMATKWYEDHRTGCNFSLMSVTDRKDIDQKILDQAKAENIPILFREKGKNKFVVFGDNTGNGNWTYTEMKEGLDELQKLPFDRRDMIRRNDPEFTPSLIDKLGQGHVYLNEFGSDFSHKSRIFWVKGIRKLQERASSRDAHVADHGAGNLVDSKVIPPRAPALHNSNGVPRFFNPAFDPGCSVYVGYYYGIGWAARGAAGAALQDAQNLWKTYVSQKQQHCKTYATSGQLKNEPVSNTLTRF